MTRKQAPSPLNFEKPYADHLAEVNETTDVVATEDIYNSDNVLLVAKGSPLNRATVGRLKQHALEKILDRQVEINGCLTNKKIYEQILAMLAKNPGFQEIHDSCKCANKLEQICLAEAIPVSLRNKLTVMAERMPDEYQHSLFAAWAGIIIALEMGLSQREAQHAFICGLFHDIGVLHLPHDLTDGRKKALSEADWRKLQSHVVIGSMIIKELGSYPSTVTAGILEHHERIDQTGYPTRKAGHKLSIYGQIIASGDLLYKLCSNEVTDQSNRLTASLPHFKMHQGAFREDIFNAIVCILSRCEYQPDTSLPPEQAKQQALQLNSKLTEMEGCAARIMQLEQPNPQPTGLQALSAIGLSLLHTIRQSGITMDHTRDFLNTVEPANERESLSEIGAMQYELLWLFKRFSWNIDELLKGRTEWEGREQIKQLGQELKATLDAAWTIESVS